MNFKRIKNDILETYKSSEQLHRKIDIPKYRLFLDMLYCNYKYGASIEDYVVMEFYRKSAWDRNRFNTFRRNFKYLFNSTSTANGERIFNNKNEFNEAFKEFISHKWMYADRNFNDVLDFINQQKEVIVKPVNSFQGAGVYKLSASDSKGVEELKKNIENGDTFMIEEIIKQSSEMSKLNPSSVNTLRIETLLDKSGNVHIINQTVIIGTGGRVVSNTHFGGIMCHVDLNTGVIDSIARNPEGEYFRQHPDTGITLPGFQIPRWKEVIEFAKKMAKVNSEARFIGWDIVVTDSGIDVIEGNIRPGHCTQACDNVGRWPELKKYL